MRRVVGVIAAIVGRAPIAVVVGAVAVTGVLGWYAQDVRQAVGNEGFAPDAPELVAAEEIGARFGESDEAVVQVLVETPGPFIGQAGLEATTAITQALEDGEQASHLSATPERPAVLSPLLPVQQAIAEGAPADLADEQIQELFSDALADMPPGDAGLLTGLLPDGAGGGDPQATSALLVVFIQPPEVPGGTTARFDALVETESAIADAIAGTDLPAGTTAEPFAFELLFSDTGAFEEEIARLFLTAFLIILAILSFVYWVRPGGRSGALRSVRRAAADVLLTMATIIMAILWMNGAAALLGPGYADVLGPLTEVTQVLPVLLIGLGVDYGIHLTSRYREELGGRSVSASVSRAVRTVGIALVLATVTTAVGFLTNVVNPVPALVDFGALAAVGIVSSFVLMLTFVPAVRLLLDRRAERRGRLPQEQLSTSSERLLPQLMSRSSVLARRAAVPTLLVTVLLGGSLGFYGMRQLETRFSFTDFVPSDSPLIVTYERIIEDFGGGFGERTQVLATGPVATAAAHNAQVEALDALAGVDDVITADGRAAATSPVLLLAQLTAPGPDGAPTAPPVAEAAATAGLGDDLTVPPDADVAALYDAMFEAAPEPAAAVLDRAGDGTFTAALIDVRTSAGEQRAGQLAEDVDAALAPLRDAGVEAIATSNEIINDAIVSALSDSQLSSLAITLAAALVLLVLTFAIQVRRPMLGLLTIAPVGLVVLWTFGAMAATGIPFGPVTATIAALAIGIGVPYTIHVANRFREDRARLPLDEALASTLRNTGGALAGSAFTTVAGFGVLVTSSLTPFRQFGLVTAFAIGFALLAATIVLPSLLALWDRYHQARGRPSAFGYRPRHLAEGALPAAPQDAPSPVGTGSRDEV